MQCPRCQVENDADARFCEDCGARLEAACPSCGTPVTPGKKFCRSCGAALTPGPSRFTSPESYTPKHLAEKILTSKAALEGERKHVTVLFADLKGSMELLADRDPEEARKILDSVLSVMMEAVHRYEGTVNQVMGDGIMALFGAPVALEDHAVRACYAALRMQELMKQCADDLGRLSGSAIQLRVGLNSGDVVVRSIASDLHMDYTAVGQTTHLAARMEQMATPRSILMTSNTFSLSESYIDVARLGPVAVKGLHAPVEVYELRGARPARSRLHATATRGLSHFVGRTTEIQQLNSAWDDTRAGRGQVVGVVGDPGVGKSRLFWEFVHSQDSDKWLRLEASCASYGNAATYFALSELLRDYFRIGPRDSKREIEERVTAKIISLDERLQSTLYPILALLDVVVDDDDWQSLDPVQRRRRTVDAFRRLVGRESQNQPVAVLIEDLHSVDGGTQSVLDALVESLPALPILLLVNYRPEYEPRWAGKSYYRQLQIGPLGSRCGALLDELLGGDSSLGTLKELLVRRTEGNPLFLEESVRALVETGGLVGAPGTYRPAARIDQLAIPATVQSILAARIDRLPADDKRLLQTAAVIGKDVALTLLEAVAAETENDIRGTVERLRESEFLYESKLFPDVEYTFKHALTAEVAYAGVLSDRRRDLHAGVAQTIARIYAARLDEHVEDLARHAQLGALWEDAVRYGRMAGTRAMSRSAFPEAVGHYEAALAALDRIPKSTETMRTTIDLHLSLRGPLWQLARFDDVLTTLREAERLAQEMGDRGRLARAAVQLWNLFWITGNQEECQRLLADVQAAAAVTDDPPLQVTAAIQLGQAFVITASGILSVRDVLESALKVADGGRMPHDIWGSPRILLRALLTNAHAHLGEFQYGLARGTEGVEIADSVGIPFGQAYIRAHLAWLHGWRGEFEPARLVSDRALELCQEHNLPLMLPSLMSAKGWALCGLGRANEGIPVLQRGIEIAESRRILQGHTLWVTLLADSYLLAGDASRSSQTALRALELARRSNESGMESWLQCLLGDIANVTCTGEEAAERGFRDSMVRAERMGLRPLVARCHLGLGKLYRRKGNRQEAQEHLVTATTMYREMDMRFWREQAESEMAALR